MADFRICFIGDSFTQGTGDEACLGWPGRVCASARARGHAVTVYNLGIRRETTDDIRARWRAEVAPRLVAGVDGRIVFSFGANDADPRRWAVARPAGPVRGERPGDDLRGRCCRTRCSSSGRRPPPRPDKTARHAELAARYAEVCRGLDVPFLDILEPIQSVDAWWEEVAAGDGIHPGARGYAALAALVDAWPAWRAWVP